MTVATLLEAVFAREGPQVLAALSARARGDIVAAEEAYQEACARAVVSWASTGLPPKPGAWLTVVGQRCRVDEHRHQRRHDGESALEHLTAPSELERSVPDSEPIDERLKVLFLCCHPALEPRVQVSLALRLLCGLTTRQIARAFMEDESTTAQRLTRAKTKIREAGISVELPGPEALTERLSAVLMTLYLLFNEGYAATDADDLMRPELCGEAIGLQRLLLQLLPERLATPAGLQAESEGLLALMLAHHARREARVDASGALVLLALQDRSRFDRVGVAEAEQVLERALARHAVGPYQLQAAIAVLHATAPSADATDWRQIAGLYTLLERLVPTPMISLNAAVARAFAGDLTGALEALEALAHEAALAQHHLVHTSRAGLLVRAGRLNEAVEAYARALGLVSNAVERRCLEALHAEALAALTTH